MTKRVVSLARFLKWVGAAVIGAWLNRLWKKAASRCARWREQRTDRLERQRQERRQLQNRCVWSGAPFGLNQPVSYIRLSYFLTPHELIVKEGIIADRTRRVALFAVTEVNVRSSALQKLLLRTGDIQIERFTKSPSRLQLKNIRQPHNVASLIIEYASKSRSADAEGRSWKPEKGVP